VQWDENATVPRPEMVSPSEINPFVTPISLNPLPAPRTKRPRANAGEVLEFRMPHASQKMANYQKYEPLRKWYNHL
jgi:hypothetical protein